MKYKDPMKRLKWETKHRVLNPGNTQRYYMSTDIKNRQDGIEVRIAQYIKDGHRLTKQMRSYLETKNSNNKQINMESMIDQYTKKGKKLTKRMKCYLIAKKRIIANKMRNKEKS